MYDKVQKNKLLNNNNNNNNNAKIKFYYALLFLYRQNNLNLSLILKVQASLNSCHCFNILLIKNVELVDSLKRREKKQQAIKIIFKF